MSNVTYLFMVKLIKITLSILLILCLFKMPYGFYQLVRLVALIGFGFLALQAYQLKKQTGVLIFLGLAVLFQPFVKITLGRDIWTIIDAIVAVGLIITVIKD